MNILALEPYHGGSHRAFLRGWINCSRHQFKVLSLPAHHWKWRMRHAAVTFADQLAHHNELEKFDLCWSSSMLDLAMFKGLAPHQIAALPSIIYFHENQLTYPVRKTDVRDVHFGFTNMTSALAADQVWWNSAYNRDSFLGALRNLVNKIPQGQLQGIPHRICLRSQIHPPGIDPVSAAPQRPPGPLHILWAARWEHDKNPETFFAELERMHQPFRVSVIGQAFKDTPLVFSRAQRQLGDRICRWGYQPTRHEYEAALREADVIVSTARHEFFGISVLEAVSAGCRPVLPRRLSYPELFSDTSIFYDDLALHLDNLAQQLERGAIPPCSDRVEHFFWCHAAPRLDDQMEAVNGLSG